MDMVEHGRKPLGKRQRKIEMKKVESKEKREVTFSKRRKGLFGKASELSLLCGAEVTAIVYSPSGNQPYLFGSTSADAILKRFIGLKYPKASGAPCGDSRLNEYRKQDRDLHVQLDNAKKLQVCGQGHAWCREDPIEDLQEVQELEYYIERLEKLKEKVGLKVEELRSGPDSVARIDAP